MVKSWGAGDGASVGLGVGNGVGGVVGNRDGHCVGDWVGCVVATSKSPCKKMVSVLFSDAILSAIASLMFWTLLLRFSMTSDGSKASWVGVVTLNTTELASNVSACKNLFLRPVMVFSHGEQSDDSVLMVTLMLLLASIPSPFSRMLALMRSVLSD